MRDYVKQLGEAVGTISDEWEEVTRKSLTVPCPFCGAAPLQACKEHSGWSLNDTGMHATRRTLYLKILKYSSREDLRDPDRYDEIVMRSADGPVTLPDAVAARYGLLPQRGLDDG